MEYTLSLTCARADDAELYAMNRLTEADAASMEEHLLVCTACQQALDFADEFIAFFREAEQSPELQPVHIAALAS